ncbi:unnamed protein product [Didymodactylos carnosus]|uniref:Uncharacterized protein n=2 Tax=Didymodactylos carnosus TaxID=1234261 RepID=A0A8S2E9V8_9BILA|nr:unnamed protein product [Didymodactylos carnosus]CAF3850868.1 unnamed protein product [Didymodactylos carnosus]
MLSTLLLFGLLGLVSSQDSTSTSSRSIVIHQVEVGTSSIGRIKYEDGEVILYPNQRKPTDIFFTPFPRVDPSNSECQENILSSHVELSLSVELYTPQLVAVERQVEITTEHITETTMFNRIRSQFPRSDMVTLTGDDFKQLLSEVTDKITMKLRVQEGFDSQLQDPITLDRVLERQLQFKQVRTFGVFVHLEKVEDQQWDSLYWTRDLTRPDRLAKVINTIVRKNATDTNHFLYDSQVAKNSHKLGVTQHDIDRVEQLDKLLATHAHRKLSSESRTGHSGGGVGLDVIGLFTIRGGGGTRVGTRRQIPTKLHGSSGRNQEEHVGQCRKNPTKFHRSSGRNQGTDVATRRQSPAKLH